MRIFSIYLLVIIPLIQGCKYSSGHKAEGTKSLLLYVGTYTGREGEGKAEGIYVYEFDLVSGKLSYISKSPATVNPSYLDLSPDGNFLYAVNETGSDEQGIDGFVSAFRLIEEGTQLRYINQVSSVGDYPCYIQIDPTARFVMVANYGSGNVALFPLNINGSLQTAASIDQHEGRGPASQQKSAHAHSIVSSNDNRFVYSCDLGTDQILIYKLQTDSARLIKVGSYNTMPGSGPRHLAFHPNKNILYVINELNATIECMHRDTVTGALTRFQVISTIADSNAAEAGSADIHITPSGEFLYVTNRGNFNTLAMYVINAETGELLLTGFQSVKGKTPRNFVIDPTGKWLLVANQDSNTLVIFRIDPKMGVLVDSGIEIKIPTPVCLKFGPYRIR